MPSHEEMRTQKTEVYYSLLRIKDMNKKANIEVLGLDDYICQIKSSMLEPDIAWTEKNFAEAHPKN